ncbi:MAG: choice-of-anchor D domain-containing protein, partial [Ignavibacteria bacterium]|nr:choice-of-anchor D domain-containing protein [Ignavibacteria bacterium]
KLLGYEGIPWKILVNELLDAGLPTIGRWGGAKSAHSDALLLGAGMNWHLFETIDILKYSTGDTLHLSVSPLLTLPPINMLNNEQLSVPGVPFPNLYNQQYVSYGVIDGTNIGYIYLCAEVEGISDQQFYEAVTALEETDALIIDMRLNFGGWAFFNNSLEILFNESHLTIEDAYRCNINDFTLCPSGNSSVFSVPGNPPALYDRPIAIFLGPTCVSMGDITAQRFRYHPTVRFFAKSSAASLGDNVLIVNFPNWHIKYSISDMFHVNEPGEYLNRTEFPIDYPVWFDPSDVANGYDTVVEEALEWMNNLVYGHDVTTNKNYALPGIDTITVLATVENPNSHNVSAQVFIKDLDNTIIDSLELFPTESGDIWQGEWLVSNFENNFKLDIKATDLTTGESFTIENVNRITTAGPVTLDSVYVFEGTNYFSITPFLKNQSADSTIKNASVRLICHDPWIISINPNSRGLPNIPPGVMVNPSAPFTVTVDTLTFPGYFNFKVDVLSDGWVYWTDSMRVPPIAIISINPLVLNFGEVAIDSSATKTFTITNYGDEDLIISHIGSNEPVFTVNITNAVVPPDSSEDVEVTFTPTGSISFNGKIEITHNAAGSPDSVIVTGDGVTGIKDELLNTIPTEFIVYQNYPNPFNPSTSIIFGLPEVVKVRLVLFNLLGEVVAKLVDEEKTAGYYTVEFNAANLPSGVYFYQLKAGEFIETKKMLLLK